MKILYICTDPGVDLSGQSGGSIHIRSFVRAMAGLGHEVVVVCSSVSNGTIHRLLKRKVPWAGVAVCAFTRKEQCRPRIDFGNCYRQETMRPQPKRERTIGYVVSTWPRLSQTFVLNEILSLEERGLDLRIFSAKDPTEQLVNAKVADVRAPVFYLAFHGRYSKIFFGNLRIASRQPGRYLKTLAHALGYGRRDILRRFFQAGYLAEQLRRDSVAHLHAHFATAPATVAMFTHELTGVPFTFTAHARDIYSDTQPELLRAEMKRARSVVTVTEYNRRHLRKIDPSLNGKVRCIDSIFDFSGFDFQWPRVSGLAAPLILSVARLVEKKGLEDLILAADILRWQGQRFRMQIIGDGHLRQVLDNKIAALGLEEHVTLSGAQTHEEVKLAYGRAHVFALPCVVAADGDRDSKSTSRPDRYPSTRTPRRGCARSRSRARRAHGR